MEIIYIGMIIFGILFFRHCMYNTESDKRAKFAEETAFRTWANRSPRPHPLAVAYVEYCVRHGGYLRWEHAACVADYIDWWHLDTQQPTGLLQIDLPYFAPAMLQITIPNFMSATQPAKQSLPGG